MVGWQHLLSSDLLQGHVVLCKDLVQASGAVEGRVVRGEHGDVIRLVELVAEVRHLNQFCELCQVWVRSHSIKQSGITLHQNRHPTFAFAPLVMCHYSTRIVPPALSIAYS
jgi:hypothetical protein